MSPRSAHSRGHTLPELTIALALGMLIVTACLSLYGAQRAAFERAADVARMHDAASIALDMIGQQIQMAGFLSGPYTGADLAAPVFGCAQGRVTGCDFTYVKGSSVTLSSGITTDTALWPVQSGPFADYTITPALNFAGGSVWPTWEEPYNGVLSAGELDAIDAARVQVNTGAAADPPARGRWEQQRRLTEAIRSIEAARQQPSAR